MTRITLRRRGSVYIVVLGVITLLSVLGVGALMLAQTARRSAAVVSSMESVSRAAQSGLESAVARLGSDPDWRATLIAGDGEIATMPLPGAKARIVAENPSGGPVDPHPWAPIRLRSTAADDRARRIVSVELAPDITPIACTAHALYVAGSVNSSGTCITDGHAYVLGDFSVKGVFDAAMTSVFGSLDDTSGCVKQPVVADAKIGPPDSFLLQHLLTLSPPIPITKLSNRRITGALIDPRRSTFGQTDSSGVLIIDCEGQDVEIGNCRIVGTLIFLNTAEVRLTGAIHWEPADPLLPAMVAFGPVRIQTVSTDLRESTIGVNLNPAGSAYRGSEDTDTTDAYASVISGLVYAEGDVEVDNTATFEGTLLIGGGINISGSLRIRAPLDPVLIEGFAEQRGWVAVPGSWLREVE